MPEFAKLTKIPKKFQPPGFEIIYEDLDLIVGIKAAGYLTVSALWNHNDTVHSGLNDYIRKGNARSRKCAFVVHRLDQWTTGLLVFAKSEEAQNYLKDNWRNTIKSYLCVIEGRLKNKEGTLESYLEEDEDYKIHSNQDGKGKLAQTQYRVVTENPYVSLVKINLLTGRKNQIRVHMSDHGHPIVGDIKYGSKTAKKKPDLLLHAAYLELTHPFTKKRLSFFAPPPDYFNKHFAIDYEELFSG